MRRSRVTAGITGLILALALVGCGGEDDSDGDGGSSPKGDAQTVQITIENGDISPKGERVETTAGTPVTLEITSDVAGELHVHSRPEQEIEYDEGTSDHELTIDTPGIVEVESHEPPVQILQLQVNPK